MVKKQKNYFTTREASELLGVAVSTIQIWTNNGFLRAWVTSGGHRRIARDAVEKMLNQQQVMVVGNDNLVQPLSVVIVEDNAQQLRMYEQQFRSWNKNIHLATARDGFEGSIKIGQLLPDVIITDLRMPNMDGFRMIHVLKELPELAHCLIIVVTGVSENEIKTRGELPDGVQLFIKPVFFENLKLLMDNKMQAKANFIKNRKLTGKAYGTI